MKKAEDIVEGFLHFLSSSRNLDLLPQIISLLSQEQEGKKDEAKIISAVVLNPEEEERIKQYLKRKFGKNFVLKIEINEEIMGGLIIKVEDKVIDLSLDGKLKSLKEQL
ncbi:MAG: ATP synthase F1 subunit delta [Patescibacteria group bacterium]|nr:ATP synthase F1 subunit delta [Patescibacteria group bacterium]MCL5095337.1 ATP synthase F1 subunit delta [Patescibacteria group bacterium]